MKRVIDWVSALFLLILLLPIIVTIALVIRIMLGSPIFFRQDRTGHKGKNFTVIKFRTLTEERDTSGTLLDDGLRMTPLGGALRRSSLDELPSLINVLLGQMSFVGPRPFVADYEDRYTPNEARRHNVRPGITGWAQVNGRNALSWDERLELDVWYVDHISFLLDIRILVKTLGVVFKRSNTTADDHPTMPEFRPKA